MAWCCQVAGEMFDFKPGKLYHERGEIKRMFFEAGCLDPACLEIEGADTGLLAEPGGAHRGHVGRPRGLPLRAANSSTPNPCTSTKTAGSSGL